MSPTLSVVMPVFNEGRDLPATIEALVEAVRRSELDAELVLVDDGSTDGSAEIAATELAGRLPLKVVSQPNRGRFLARRAGVERAGGDWLLLLDGRVRVDSGSLEFARRRISEDAPVWTGHVDVEAEGSPYGTFWKLIADLAWSEYFDHPRETSFGSAEFDHFPKGTTCFLAPRQLLLEAMDAFHSAYADARHANDDTPLLRWIAEREPIHVAPSFRCSYRPRATLRTFLRHSRHRGVVFVDGHGRPESRYFPVVVAFFPVSGILVLASLRRPALVPRLALATSLLASGYGIARRRSAAEVASLALLTPLYAVAHGLGMWQGLLMAVGSRSRADARR